MEFKDKPILGFKESLSPPIMNGGGCVKTVEDVKTAAQSLASVVVAGSFTPLKREGNSGNVFWSGPQGTLNSWGMPNGGLPYLEEHLPEMADICHKHNKKLVVNIAGFTKEDYGMLAVRSETLGADGIDVNLGCPNVVAGQNKRKPIATYNLDFFKGILWEIVTFAKPKIPISLKLSPIFDQEYLRELAGWITFLNKEFSRRFVTALTIMNTVPNCFALDEDGNPEIATGLAGLSGPAVKHIGLGQVRQWRDVLSELKANIDIIGVGGISSGRDILDYERAGADAFQVTTELLKTGTFNPRPLERMVQEYVEL